MFKPLNLRKTVFLERKLLRKTVPHRISSIVNVTL